MAITKFRGEYAFLSNFYECDIVYKGLRFKCSEALFQAMKAGGDDILEKFSKMDGKEAKRKGKRLELRADWEDVKIKIMYAVVLEKFKQNDYLRDKLLATGNELLIEGNTWHDTFWGVCGGRGHNMLGRILMLVISRLRDKRY